MTEQYRTEKVVFGPAGTGGVLITVLVLMEVEGSTASGHWGAPASGLLLLLRL